MARDHVRRLRAASHRDRARCHGTRGPHGQQPLTPEETRFRSPFLSQCASSIARLGLAAIGRCIPRTPPHGHRARGGLHPPQASRPLTGGTPPAPAASTKILTETRQPHRTTVTAPSHTAGSRALTRAVFRTSLPGTVVAERCDRTCATVSSTIGASAAPGRDGPPAIC